MNSENCPPHEMSYSTIEKLQYGESRAQESDCPAPHVPFRAVDGCPFLPARVTRAALSGRSSAALAVLTLHELAIQYLVSAARRGGTFHFDHLL
jgi:hypothetical protein